MINLADYEIYDNSNPPIEDDGPQITQNHLAHLNYHQVPFQGNARI